jgi:hypothetical protein
VFNQFFFCLLIALLLICFLIFPKGKFKQKLKKNSFSNLGTQFAIVKPDRRETCFFGVTRNSKINVYLTTYLPFRAKLAVDIGKSSKLVLVDATDDVWWHWCQHGFFFCEFGVKVECVAGTSLLKEENPRTITSFSKTNQIIF